MARILYLTLGYCALILGVIGIFLPVLPTTPFILLAALCFSKSSPRLHAWLLGHRAFGPPLRDWNEAGVIRLPAKCMATVMMVLSFTGLTLWSPMPLVGKVILDCAGVGVLAFIWSRPSAKV